MQGFAVECDSGGAMDFDMKWTRSIHPNAITLEQWMRERNYEGKLRLDLLKNTEDAKSVTLNREHIAKL